MPYNRVDRVAGQRAEPFVAFGHFGLGHALAVLGHGAKAPGRIAAQHPHQVHDVACPAPTGLRRRRG